MGRRFFGSYTSSKALPHPYRDSTIVGVAVMSLSITDRNDLADHRAQSRRCNSLVAIEVPAQPVDATLYPR